MEKKSPFIYYDINNPVEGHYYRIKEKDRDSYIAVSLTLDEVKNLKKGLEVEEITKEEWSKAICEN